MSEPTVHNLSTYTNRKCRCSECREANRVWQAAARKKRNAALPADDPRHGKATTYTNHACRCDSCREAHRVYNKTRASLV